MNICPTCDIPLDARIFDTSRVFHIVTPGEVALPGERQASLMPGESLELARYELFQEYCGSLLYFAQFTDRHAANPGNILTPGYEWTLLVNNYPLDPWLTFDHILNPWGMAGFPLALRLEANSTLSLTIRNQGVDPADNGRWLRVVGGRILGRFWFDREHGGPSPLRTQQPWETSAPYPLLRH